MARRFGEGHPRCKLSDHEIDLIFDLASCKDASGRPALTLRDIAEKMGVSVGYISKLLNGGARQQVTICKFLVATKSA
jgi:Helix-turn-helix